MLFLVRNKPPAASKAFGETSRPSLQLEIVVSGQFAVSYFRMHAEQDVAVLHAKMLTRTKVGTTSGEGDRVYPLVVCDYGPGFGDYDRINEPIDDAMAEPAYLSGDFFSGIMRGTSFGDLQPSVTKILDASFWVAAILQLLAVCSDHYNLRKLGDTHPLVSDMRSTRYDCTIIGRVNQRLSGSRLRTHPWDVSDDPPSFAIVIN